MFCKLHVGNDIRREISPGISGRANLPKGGFVVAVEMFIHELRKV